MPFTLQSRLVEMTEDKNYKQRNMKQKGRERKKELWFIREFYGMTAVLYK